MRHVSSPSFKLFTTALTVLASLAVHAAHAAENSRCEAVFAQQTAAATSTLAPTTVDADTVLRDLARLYVNIEDKMKAGGDASLARTLHDKYAEKSKEAHKLGLDLSGLDFYISEARQQKNTQSQEQRKTLRETREQERDLEPWVAEHTLKGHADSIGSVAFRPDGKLIVTGSRDNDAIIWDAATGQPIHTLDGHTGAIASLAFSPDGKTIVTGSFDKTAIVWDATTGVQLHTLTGHTNKVNSVAFSPDGKYIVTVSEDRTGIVWDAITGAQLHTFNGHQDTIGSIVFSPNGETIVTGSDDNTAIIWQRLDNAESE